MEDIELPFSNAGKRMPFSTNCKVCSNKARYCYFNAIVCQSCKMFFKRNAEHRQPLLKCIGSNNCEIDMHRRPMCAACRLKKCFQVGMCSTMIRGSYVKKREPTDLIKSKKQNQVDLKLPRLIAPSSILTLNLNQWNLLTNLIQCYDKYVDNSNIQDFIREQTILPVKVRFKYSTTKDFFTSIKAQTQLVSENNPHLLLLPPDDRQILLQKTVRHVTSLGGMFVLRRYNLLDYASFYNSAEMIFRPKAVQFTRYVINQLNSDETLIKLILAILSFSTINYTTYQQSDSSCFSNIKNILSIQDIYTEITWRYLVYRYGYDAAIIHFSNVIRCLFLINNAIVEAQESQPFVDMIGTVIQQTEKSLSI